MTIENNTWFFQKPKFRFGSLHARRWVCARTRTTPVTQRTVAILMHFAFTQHKQRKLVENNPSCTELGVCREKQLHPAKPERRVTFAKGNQTVRLSTGWSTCSFTLFSRRESLYATGRAVPARQQYFEFGTVRFYPPSFSTCCNLLFQSHLICRHCTGMWTKTVKKHVVAQPSTVLHIRSQD